MRPSATMQTVLDRLLAEDGGLTDPTTLPPQTGRALAAMTHQRWNDNLPPMAEARSLLHGGLPARWLVPPQDNGHEAILFVHGGGWAFCSTLTHEGMARRLAQTCACPVLSLEYRLAPEHPYPAGLEDVLTAWQARPPGRRWSIAGDSAGANLCLAAMLRLIAKDAPLPAQALLFYGVYGTDFDTPSYRDHADAPGLSRAKMIRFWDWYAPPETRDTPWLAPLAAGDAALSRLPPLYLNAAEIDPLRSETEALAARLQALGRTDTFDLVPGVIHGFMQMGNSLDEAQQAFARLGAIFRQRAA